jgi:hypothetical protein
MQSGTVKVDALISAVAPLGARARMIPASLRSRERADEGDPAALGGDLFLASDAGSYYGSGSPRVRWRLDWRDTRGTLTCRQNTNESR